MLALENTLRALQQNVLAWIEEGEGRGRGRGEGGGGEREGGQVRGRDKESYGKERAREVGAG